MPHTFVLVHGAWHGGWCWRRVADILERQGHKVFTPTLTGLGERSHLMRAGINVSTHVTDVVNVLKWERLKDVVLCGHSYGGLVVSGVAEQSAAAIGSIVFLDAFVPENGQAMGDLTNQATRDALKAAGERGDLGVPARSAAAFLVNEKDQAWVDAMCVPQPIGCMTETDEAHRRAREDRQEVLHPRRVLSQSGLRRGLCAGQGRQVLADL